MAIDGRRALEFQCIDRDLLNIGTNSFLRRCFGGGERGCQLAT